MDRSPCPWFSITLMQMRMPNPHSLIGSKGTVLTGLSRATLIGQSCAALIGWDISVLLVGIGLQEILYKGQLRW